MEVLRTDNFRFNVVTSNDADDIRQLTTSEDFIKSGGVPLSENSIKLFTEQDHKIHLLKTSLQNKYFNLEGDYLVLGCRLNSNDKLNENNKLIAVMQVCDDKTYLGQCIAMDPNYKSYMTEIYDSYNNLFFSLDNCNLIKCAIEDKNISEINFAIKYGYIKSEKYLIENVCFYELSKKN